MPTTISRAIKGGAKLPTIGDYIAGHCVCGVAAKDVGWMYCKDLSGCNNILLLGGPAYTLRLFNIRIHS